MGTTTSNPYGTPGGDEATYNISDVSAGSIIDNAKWTEIYNGVNSERSRRGHGNISNPGFTGAIQASDLNALKDGIHNAGYTSGFGGVSISGLITALSVNQMIDKLQDSGNVCLCNCNYCTCNCNYCTCNCNYSCTCNCNYSDERLKRDIEFLEERSGINYYTFKYLWDDVKRTGVMAQEILKSKWKDAVRQDRKGYYMVDYSMLP